MSGAAPRIAAGFSKTQLNRLVLTSNPSSELIKSVPAKNYRSQGKNLSGHHD